MSLLIRLSLTAPLLAGCAATPTETAPPTPGEPNAAWLHQLVGDWVCTVEAPAEPGGDPQTWEFAERVRSIGGRWIQAEGSAEYEGAPFHSVMTLGYDEAEGAFVGTWIDTVQTRLWVYRGWLDKGRATLTLEAEGPSFEDPTVTANYRDAITIVGPDERRLTSSVETENGEWVTFMSGEYRRAR